LRLSSDLECLLRNPDSPNYAVHDALLDMGVEMASIYVVQSKDFDNVQWAVKAFLNEKQAETFKEQLRKAFEEYRAIDEGFEYDSFDPGEENQIMECTFNRLIKPLVPHNVWDIRYDMPKQFWVEEIPLGVV
jgi:hypothetical protein